MVKTRNHNREQYIEETYKHGKIFAWKNTWEEYVEKRIEEKLRSVGFKNEDFFKYNSLKDLERIKIKQEMYDKQVK